MKNLEELLKELNNKNKISDKSFRKLQSKYPKRKKYMFSKSEILLEYRRLLDARKIKRAIELERFLKMKPTRTISGVAPVTVLTKPYKCPGECIFCPAERGQPKSYLSSEPGAMRAKMFKFDPYVQTQVRIQALKNIGHNTEKVELIILGGTWNAYPKKYQLWFITRCFEALNDLSELDTKVQTGFKPGGLNQRFEPTVDDLNVIVKSTKDNQLDHLNQLDLETLKSRLLNEQTRNEAAKHRCIGLVTETRPDFISENEVKWFRFLGVTKVQLGVQSLDNEILKLNKRGHFVADTGQAIKLLRLGGFKLHLHWMVNLCGSDPRRDFDDFKRLFDDDSIRPDELKIYPCLLLKGTPLYELYKNGKYKPYTRKQLLELLIKCKQVIPKYCRVSRLFRDIPSFEIEAGVKETNFREVVKEEMQKRGLKCNCIRCREIKNEKLKIRNLKLEIETYKTNVTNEYFLSYVTRDGKIAGFLRLSLPICRNFIHEIPNCAMIREVHVYGVTQSLKLKSQNLTQHRGIGTKLIQKAEKMAKEAGFMKIAVISAVGTREYYKKRGYVLGELYMAKRL